MADVKISALPTSTIPLAGTEVLPIVQSGVTRQVSVVNLTAGRDVAVKTVTADNVKTSAAAANLDISGNTIAAAGSDANVDVNINAKGTGIAYLNQKWGVNASGTLVPALANTYDIGNSTNNPRDVNVDRYLNIKDNIVIGTSGKGIDFSVTANSGGTMTSELFADYEEGTWTPTLGTIGNQYTSVTYNSGVGGKYVKIGNMVTVQGYMRTNAVTIGSANNIITIQGLPYACASSTGSTQNALSSAAVSESESWALNNPTAMRTNNGATYLLLFYRTAANGGAIAMSAATMTGTGSDANILRFTCSYMTA